MRSALGAFLSLAAIGGLAAAGPVPTAPAAAPVAAPSGGGTNEMWFPVGETLTYRISWGVLPVGESVVTSRWIEDGGRRLLEITFRTRSNKVLSSLYPVDDTIQVVVEPEPFRPVTFFMDQREGRHKNRELTTFDYARGVARWERLTKQRTRDVPIGADVVDLVTFMYTMRKGGFAVGSDRRHRVLTDGKVYDLVIKTEAIETVDVPGYGPVECARLDPSAQFEGLFVRKGKLTAWVTRDARSLCARVVAGVPVVGNVTAVLTSVSGPGSDRWVAGAQPSAPPPSRVRP